jgi:predicted dehydrogenase
MIKVGIIGCGGMSVFHIGGYLEAGAQIAYVCDINEEAAKSVAAKYGAKYTTDYKTLLADPEIEMVSVLVFSRMHKEICLAAIAAGKAVICEKTLAPNPEDAEEIAAAVEKAGTFFVTAYMKRFFPAAQKAKEMLAGMGRIISVYARSWQPAGDLWTVPIDDTANFGNDVFDKYSGGVLVCGGSHILDLIHWFAGKPLTVSGQMYAREGTNLDIQANAMFRCESGALVHFETCWHPLAFAGYERNGWDERIEINTVSGRLDLYTVMWNQPEHNGALLVHQDAATGVTTEYRYPALNPFHIEIAENIRRYQSGEPGTPSVRDGVAVDRIISEIVKSDKEMSTRKMEW